MIINKFLLLTIASSLIGCAATNVNVEHFDHSYYKKIIAESGNVKKTRVFLGENNIKLVSMSIVDNMPSGSLGSILINGERRSLVTPDMAKLTNDHYFYISDNELASYTVHPKDIGNYKPIKNGKYFNTVFCVDYTHANLAENNQSLILPISYIELAPIV